MPKPKEVKRVPWVVLLIKLRYTTTFQQWLEVHQESTGIRRGCCDELQTLIFRSVAEPDTTLALLLREVDYDMLKKYLNSIEYGTLAQSTEAFMVHRCLPPGLPPACLARCLRSMVPIHGHFISLWTVEQDYEKWLAYHSSEPLANLRADFGVPVALYKCITNPNKILGIAPDVNWKACIRYLGSRELYESIPAARRAGEREFVILDGAKTDRERDLMGTDVPVAS